MTDYFEKKCKSGVVGFDEILGGGFPSFSMYAIQGEPGSGKTTFGLNFLLEGVKQKEKVLYITFSETQKELDRVARSHGMDLSKIVMMDLTILDNLFNPDEQNSLFHPAEIELNHVSNLILAKVKEIKPDRIVFDSVSEMRLLAESALRYRRQILAMKQELAQYDCTVLFLDDLSHSNDDLQIHSIAHGVVTLTRMNNEYGGERRRLRVMKLRGVNFIGGYHDFEIRKGGITVYPRMTSANHEIEIDGGQLKSESKELDSLLGGGLDRGTANLFIGPAGTSKSTLATKYALSANARGEKAIFFTFDETITNLSRRSHSLGMKVQENIKSGLLKVQKVDPAELSPGAFAGMIQKAVKDEKYSVVIIDSLNGYIQSMPQEEFLVLQLHELLAYLNSQGVVTILTLAQQGMIGNMNSPVDLTYLADTVVLTRYFEAKGSIRKAISVIKKRTGTHESTIREFFVGLNGLQVGEILHDFEGVLTGVPKFHGKVDKMMTDQ